MIQRLVLLALTCLLVLPVSAQEGSQPATTGAEAKLAVVSKAIAGAIRPGYADFATSAAEAASAVAKLCEDPAQARLESAKTAFSNLARSWGRVEFIRFGPVAQDNRLERILFFPDRRGIALRQIQEILAEKDESATDAETLSEKSVAVQGLVGLEYSLFGSGSETLSDESGAFRCHFAQAITNNIRSIAVDIEAGWAEGSDIVTRLTQPSAGDPAYRSADDSLQEIVGVFIDGFEMIRDLRLAPPMGETAQDANPKRFLFWRSENALTSLSANFAGMRDLFAASEIGSILPEAQSYLPGAIAFEFDNATRTLDAIRPPLGDVVTDPERRRKLSYVLIVTDSLQTQFAALLAPALGLTAGFSSLDGD